MKTHEIAQGLIPGLEEIEVIDCHEHLPTEAERIAQPVDVFTLFSHYTLGDLRVAGMKDPEGTLFNRRIPLERRWEQFRPFWQKTRHTSYSRAALLSAQKFCGVDDINDDTYQTISAELQKMNKPGLYEHVLRETCNIRTTINQGGLPDPPSPLITPVLWMPMNFVTGPWEDLLRPAFAQGAVCESLDDYTDALRRYVDRIKADGAVGVKMVTHAYDVPNRREAVAAFDRIRSGHADGPDIPLVIRDYMADDIIGYCGRKDMVVCLHSGYWGDFRELAPTNIIPTLQRHPDTRFDLYHIGYPYVRDALMIGKGFANVWTNFAWTHIISQRFATDALDEAVDLLPTNKILAFGGDYGTPVEKVYGHLVMAREDIAHVLALRIQAGRLTEPQALDLARRWLFDNGKALYRLDV